MRGARASGGGPPVRRPGLFRGRPLREAPARLAARLKKNPLAMAFFALALLYLILAQVFTGSACLSYSLTGIPCPTCGATRATAVFLSGNLQKGFALYPAAPAAYLLLLTAFLRLFVLRKRFRRITAAVMILLGLLIFGSYLLGMWGKFPQTPPYVYNARSFLHRLMELLS